MSGICNENASQLSPHRRRISKVAYPAQLLLDNQGVESAIALIQVVEFATGKIPGIDSVGKLAEREGFEPSKGF